MTWRSFYGLLLREKKYIIPFGVAMTYYQEKKYIIQYAIMYAYNNVVIYKRLCICIEKVCKKYIPRNQ